MKIKYPKLRNIIAKIRSLIRGRFVRFGERIDSRKDIHFLPWSSYEEEHDVESQMHLISRKLRRIYKKIIVKGELTENNFQKDVAGKYDMDLITLSEAAKLSKYKREYLGYLVRQNKLRARKIDGSWMTKLEWVKEFELRAEQKKEIKRKELSQKLKNGTPADFSMVPHAEEKEVKRNENQKGRVKFQIKLDYRAILAIGSILFFLLASKEGLSIWQDRLEEYSLAGYNKSIDLVANGAEMINGGFAKSIIAIKVGREKFDDIANRIIENKNISNFENATGVNLTGPREEKQNIVENEKGNIAGIVAGDETQAQGTKGKVLAAADNITINPNPGDVEVSAYLMNSENNEIQNGDYDMRFAIYTVDRTEADPYPSNTDQASRVWEETQKVNLRNGLLSTYLGQVNPLPANLNFGSRIYYLGIQVGEDPELVPRKRIGAVPLARIALNAVTANSLNGYTVGNASGNIPVSNGTVNVNLNADMLDGMQASAFATTADLNNITGYDGWDLKSSSGDGGQTVASGDAVVFSGSNGISTSRSSATLTISPDYGSQAGTIAQGNTSIIVNTTGNLSGGGTGTAGGGLNLTLDTVASPTFSSFTLSSPLAVPSGGTGAGTFTQYGVLYGNAASAFGVTGAGTDNQVLIAHTGFAPTWENAAPGTPHALLSATHSDTTVAAVQRGDLITGQGASPTWTRLAKGSANAFLYSDGTDIAWSTHTLNLSGDATLSGANTGDQNLWATISSQSGSTAADSATDTLTINGGGIATTAISGDTLTVTATEVDPQVGANTTSYVPRWDGSALIAGTIFDNGTNVGIGTTTPVHTLDVVGEVNGSAGLCMGGDCRTSWGGVTGDWSENGSNIYNNNAGNVGIGTSTPGALLAVAGAFTATSVNGNTITSGTGTLTLSSYTLTVPATGTVAEEQAPPATPLTGPAPTP